MITLYDAMTKSVKELGITNDMREFIRYSWAVIDYTRPQFLEDIIEEFNTTYRARLCKLITLEDVEIVCEILSR